MKIFLKLAKELFDNGKAIGIKANITDATGWLRNHSKGVGEQIGNALSGKAKSVNQALIKSDLYDRFFAHIDDVARQYPDATVQVAAKNAKKGGYKIAKIEIKNGSKTIQKQALSIADDGTVKMKSNGMGAELSCSANAQGTRAIATSDVGATRVSYDATQKTGQIELNHAGKQVAVANYVNKGGNVSRGGTTYEVADDLVSGQMYYNGHEVSFIGEKEGLKQWADRATAEGAKQKDEMASLMTALLRPLRERFNTAIDFFKYNGRTDFEKFVSKDELFKSVKELQGEVVKLESLKKVGKITTEEVNYLGQIKSDIDQAKNLVRITV